MKENIQVTRSKEWLYNALIYLLKKNAFRKISIEDITKRAGVARPTFYRNFGSKEDILIDQGRKIYERLMIDLESGMKEGNVTYNSINKMIQVFDEYSELFEVLIKNNLEYLIFQSFEVEISHLLKKIFGVDKEDKYKTKFFEGALFSIVVEWIKNSKAESVEEMTEIIYNLVTFNK
ncbi:TetR/AcrR family transcriptional regulator [Peloplasma aerotolerans]|uniref:TetR/AcrR family transcriptional regulator n=1 Tax=Peloplasma aerotolerans TaxID=3044389 RepID=A0AAW6UAC3_9MOLU|nr:TetR/AcrR family transcriptional regulator [Mariniplasma sp. M4Ah]MDI6453041.1 TetR/AcrR family transcriptional regulator [Mariniplasma sp. M4Ah]MDR4969056.1 TetR/AcrR family transcriptional regulator [Acholeplasmataceae bacterium]